MQMLNLELLYKFSMDEMFDIVILSFHNKIHYPDIKEGVNLCEIFSMPSNVRCEHVPDRTSFAIDRSCTFLRKLSFLQPMPTEQWYFVPRTYNLLPHYNLSFLNAVPLDKFSWQSGGCIIGSPSFFLKGTSEYFESTTPRKVFFLEKGVQSQLPITFSRYYHGLFTQALANLGWEPGEYAGAQWRRGDQLLRRCNRKGRNAAPQAPLSDQSVNCGSVREFVDTVLRDCCQTSISAEAKRNTDSQGHKIYIATNEKAPKLIREVKTLSHGAMKTFSDFRFGTLLNSVDTVLEWARTMTWKGVHPIIKLLDNAYETGVRLAKKAFLKFEERLQRDESLPKYSVRIQPHRG